MIRACIAVAAALQLAACATTSHRAAPRATTVQSPVPFDSRTIMVERATSMLGQPYRFGGAAPGGFDCSGLVAYAAGGAGVWVPRTAAEQLEFGVPIARAQLQAGDLIFMHLSHKELHVAIALDNARFIHAPSSGGYVRIDWLDLSPYARGFIAARRVIPDPASAVSLPAPQ